MQLSNDTRIRYATNVARAAARHRRGLGFQRCAATARAAAGHGFAVIDAITTRGANASQIEIAALAAPDILTEQTSMGAAIDADHIAGLALEFADEILKAAT